jgi:hypothetical protein
MARQLVREERSHWRDMRLSERHRKWGFDCPAVDIDLLMLEYDHASPVALVEYKHELAASQNINHPSYQALIELGDRSGIPVFACRYKDDLKIFYIIPLNSISRNYLNRRVCMTEFEWVKFLYRLRGDVIPRDLFNQLRKGESQ